ncbi:hypothetical protein JQC92_07120 [Shewanella sp. 202IG2-18]|uniref:hypothetical protein n=1 Tax=Parashewanella hymeniacidonis TaxID=2807618 RepID=UPI0019602A8F|nr:hypothetical protein [Parashewanella hymeniacidonis]MBM7071814.1 hypothetical protein [Parashewanella hymeniacidonis]
MASLLLTVNLAAIKEESAGLNHSRIPVKKTTRDSEGSLVPQPQKSEGDKAYKFSSCKDGEIQLTRVPGSLIPRARLITSGGNEQSRTTEQGSRPQRSSNGSRRLSLPVAFGSTNQRSQHVFSKENRKGKSVSLSSLLPIANKREQALKLKQEEQAKKREEYTRTLGSKGYEKTISDEITVAKVFKKLSGEDCIKLVIALSESSSSDKHGAFEMPGKLKSNVTKESFDQCNKDEGRIRDLAAKIICNPRNVCCWQEGWLSLLIFN